MASLSVLTRALSHRNAKVFFTASLISWTGLWMHRIAISWFAWELTGSAFWVGMVAFCDLAPAVVVSPIAGAIADRTDRLKLTFWSQAMIGVMAAVIALLVALDKLDIYTLLALEVLNGIASSFAQPARQSLMPGLVPRNDLTAAVGLNSLCFNVARFVGPALAGPLIAVAGVWPAIAANAVAYFIATATTPLLKVSAEERQGHAKTKSLWGEMRDGLRYVAGHPGLGPILTYAAIVALLLRSLPEILPPYVERQFGLGAEALAILTAAFGVGALLSGIFVSARGKMRGTTRLAVFAPAAISLAMVGFIATSWFPFGVLCAAIMGAAMSVHGICAQTLAQSASDPAMRGRVLSLWGLIVRAFPALGALLLGAAGEIFGMTLPTLAAVVLSAIAIAWGIKRLPAMARVLEGDGASDPAKR